MDNVFQNHSDKREFVNRFLNDLRPGSNKATIPLLLQYAKEAQTQHIEFSKEEIEIIAQNLCQNASPEEVKRIQQLLKFL